MGYGFQAARQPAARLARLICSLLLVCSANLAHYGLAQQQLRLGDTIQVVSGLLNVRDAPGTGGTISGQVVQNQVASIVDAAPYWADGYWWWSIRAADGTAGWVAEGDASEAYIGLLQAAPAPPPAPATTGQQPAVVASQAMPAANQVTASEGAAIKAASSIQTAAAAPDTLEPETTDPEPTLDPYAHLPEPIRLEREQIDSELNGFWVSLAFYGAGPSRGGPAFSWGYGANGTHEAGTYYWCESGLLTAGAPFFERIENLMPSEVRVQNESLSIADLEVSCTGTGGLRITAAQLNRVLAFLRPAWPFPQNQASIEQTDLLIAEGHSLLSGKLTWLEVIRSEFEVNDNEWHCRSEQPNVIIASPLTQSPIRCERTHESGGVLEVLMINAEQGAIIWEFSLGN